MEETRYVATVAPDVVLVLLRTWVRGEPPFSVEVYNELMDGALRCEDEVHLRIEDWELFCALAWTWLARSQARHFASDELIFDVRVAIARVTKLLASEQDW